ncbi:MAG: 50S ribosomal protein L25 [Chloroflexota bacterium]
MSETITLEAQERKIIGKKVKQLRRVGVVPAIVYGPEFTPLSIALDEKELRMALRKAGGTQLIELSVGKTKIPTLVRDVQRDPIRGNLYHVDFYRVALDRVIRAEVPIVLVNEPPIVTSKEGAVFQGLNTVEVEALPADLPPHIEVDISGLEEIGMQLLVSDLVTSDEFTITTHEEELVVRIDYAQALEEEEEEEEFPEMVSAEPEVITERREAEEGEDEE